MTNFRILQRPDGNLAVSFNYSGLATQFGMVGTKNQIIDELSRERKIFEDQRQRAEGNLPFITRYLDGKILDHTAAIAKLIMTVTP